MCRWRQQGALLGLLEVGNWRSQKGWFYIKYIEYKIHLNFRDNIRKKECLRIDKIHSPFT